MSEITTLMSSDSVVVLGPPNTVTVQTDVGPQGNRGSKIFVGLGNPNGNGIATQQSVQLNDIYIDTLVGSGYSYMYQYVNQPGGNLWIPILRISPQLYSSITETQFSNGLASIRIPVSNITDVELSSLLPENFSIQMTPIHYNPVAISVTSVAFGGSNNSDLVISLSALEQYNSVWEGVDESLSIMIFITLVSI